MPRTWPVHILHVCIVGFFCTLLGTKIATAAIDTNTMDKNTNMQISTVFSSLIFKPYKLTCGK